MNSVEANQIALARAKFSLSGHVWFEESYALWGFSDRPAGQNVVTKCTFDDGFEDLQIDRILRSFQDANKHSNWLFGPSAEPKDLSKFLRRERRLMGPMYLPAMSAKLTDFRPLKVGVRAALIEDWDSVIEEGYPASTWYPKAARADAALFARELSSLSGAHCFTSYVDGFLAASCLLFVHDGIGGIYDVVTKPDLRGRGAAAAVISAAHALAIDLGCSEAVLQSHKRAAGLYERLGYREIGTYTSMYYSKVRMAADLAARAPEDVQST